jgi:hypothetical protein
LISEARLKKLADYLRNSQALDDQRRPRGQQLRPLDIDRNSKRNPKTDTTAAPETTFASHTVADSTSSGREFAEENSRVPAVELAQRCGAPFKAMAAATI